MKTTRTVLLTTVLTLLLLGVVGYTSCTKDYCKYVVCQNTGTCNEDGSCACTSDYVGARCERLSCVENNTGKLFLNNISDSITYIIYVDGAVVGKVHAGVLGGPFRLKATSHTYRAVDSSNSITRCSQNLILEQCKDVYLTCGN